MVKEELIKKLEKDSQKVTIVERDNYLLVEITSKNGKARFVNGESNIHHEIRCNIYGELNVSEENVLSIFNWFEKKFSDKPCLVNIDNAYLAKEWVKFLINALRKGKYNQYTHFRKKLEEFSNYEQNKTFFSKTSPKKEINRYFYYYRKLMDVLKKAYEDYPLFGYTEYENGSVYDRRFTLDIERYYCELKLINTRNGVKILILDADEEEKIIEMFEITEEKNFKTILQAFIDDKLKKQRIRTIIEPSNYHFEEFCYKNDLFDMKETIYRELLIYYTPQEIEKKAAAFKKNKQYERKELRNSFDLLEFDEKAIIVNERKQQVFIIENDKHLNQHIENVLKNIS